MTTVLMAFTSTAEAVVEHNCLDDCPLHGKGIE